MNRYTNDQPFSTIGTVVFITALMASIGNANAEDTNSTKYAEAPFYIQYQQTLSNTLGNHYTQIDTESSANKISDGVFITEVQDFYGKLLENQEPLGEPFSKILHDHLWDLYEA